MQKYIAKKAFSSITLPKNTNQALGIAEYAINFIKSGNPSQKVLEKTKLFHTDSVLCGVSALALRTNSPSLLKDEAIKYYSRPKSKGGGHAYCFGSKVAVPTEKAIVANSAAVREWDSNGTIFGFRAENQELQAGEFGHNDYYPVAIAACQSLGLDGNTALKAMICIDEIRGRLAEAYSLKTHKIDHVVFGAIASAAVYGALHGATPQMIEHAIGVFVAHYIPFRAIRKGKQLSDSKGSSAAFSTEAAIVAMKRAMNGFIGPKDIFRNPEAIFRLFKPNKDGSEDSPFYMILGESGDDFTVMGMHFKLGVYEHESAGAIEGILKILQKLNLGEIPQFLEYNNPNSIDNIKDVLITSYEPALSIIGDPAKRDPTTRQSADHSMIYIISSIIRKAVENKDFFEKQFTSFDDFWKFLMMEPNDYGSINIKNELTRKIMEKVQFVHGGPEYDKRYPDGIPTSVQLTLSDNTVIDSDFIMYPSGHARNTTADLNDILQHKFNLFGRLAMNEKEFNR